VDFVPEWKAPFDTRILDAYELDESLIQKARDLKEEYDSSLRRLMAQHAIGTEFEIWSVFVLDHNKEKKDYSIAEELGQLSLAVKTRFRLACTEAAGGTEFSTLGPFVAAMYAVTAQEVEKAVQETEQTKPVGGNRVPVRNLKPSEMPLMSFPWLFDKELGKIANGTDNDRESIAALQRVKKRLHPRRQGTALADEEDNVLLKQGVLHRGELLRLFDDADNINPTLVDGSATSLKDDTGLNDKLNGTTNEAPTIGSPVKNASTEEQLMLGPNEDLLDFGDLDDIVPTESLPKVEVQMEASTIRFDHGQETLDRTDHQKALPHELPLPPSLAGSSSLGDAPRSTTTAPAFSTGVESVCNATPISSLADDEAANHELDDNETMVSVHRQTKLSRLESLLDE
jgi:hypothetical protein